MKNAHTKRPPNFTTKVYENAPAALTCKILATFGEYQSNFKLYIGSIKYLHDEQNKNTPAALRFSPKSRQ